MNGPVYSERAQCHDCYKCVRHCPVKAIRVTEGHAVVMPERCIKCGSCVAACPSGAKKVRDDLPGTLRLLASDRSVVVSLAPSFVSEFKGIEPRQLVAALRALGFHGVSETALGAQEVSARLAQDLDGACGQVLISTACPVVVDMVTKFAPERVENFTPVHSPLLAHARLLRASLGEGIAVVFIGPCIGKKIEAEQHPELLDAVLTFEDLRGWLEREGIDPATLTPGAGDRFIPHPAAEGALYPVEGGMAQATQLSLKGDQTRFVTLSGMGPIQETLRSFPCPTRGNLFLELLACEGGCVCGPKATRRSPVDSRMKVLDYAACGTAAYPRLPGIPVDSRYLPMAQVDPHLSPARIEHTLLRLGKLSPADELNCGACGYDTCRDLAQAILSERAEGRMCVSNMRNLAQKKANALLRTLPFGVVIVGENMEIIECNQAFAQIMGGDALLVYEATPELAGAHLEKFLPFADRFREVLASGEECIRENIECNERTLSVTIFTVEPNRVVGALLLDVTLTEHGRRQVIEKAEQVIQNMLANVQEIAFSLGRNAANSQGILNSIIAEFAPPEGRKGAPDA